MGGCAHRYPNIPLPHEVAQARPVRFPAPAPGPLQRTLIRQPTTLEAGIDGVITVSSTTAPTVSVALFDGHASPAYQRTAVDRSFMTRLAFVAPHRRQAEVEAHVEIFRGSQGAALFRRVYLEAERPQPLTFRVDQTLDHSVWFEHTEIRLARGAAEVELGAEQTIKPFFIRHDDQNTSGVLFFFPHRPEVRRYFVEDYVIEQTPPLRIKARAANAETTVEVSWQIGAAPELGADGRLTFDAPIRVMPYAGRWEDALAHFRLGTDALTENTLPFGDGFEGGYWSFPGPSRDQARVHPVFGVKLARYFPGEFTSNIDASEEYYGHPGGLTWTLTTASMKEIRVYPLSEQALARENAFRTLGFFLDAGREKGAPPNLLMRPSWAARMRDPNLVRTVVFCQYWERRLEEFLDLFGSPLLTDHEKRKLHDDLQTARNVYSPGGASSWSQPTPNGGLWFDYFDEPLATEPVWIINTHITALANVGRFIALATKIGDEEALGYWSKIFERGTLGLLYATRQPWMWRSPPEDVNELHYGIGPGPRHYHFFIATDWLVNVYRVTQRMFPDLEKDVLALLKRVFSAKMMREPKYFPVSSEIAASLEIPFASTPLQETESE